MPSSTTTQLPSVAVSSSNEPAIPVRCNRTIFLRRLNGSHADRLRHLVAGTRLSETKKFIRSKNKAVTDYADRTVSHWFKQQESTVDDLDKQQRGVYTKLGRIEQERRCLQKKQQDSGDQPLRKRESTLDKIHKIKLCDGNKLSDDSPVNKSVTKSNKLDAKFSALESSKNDKSGVARKQTETAKWCPHYPIYRRNKCGKIVQSEVPYRKKYFPIPEEEDATKLTPRQKIKLRIMEENERQDEKLHSFREDLDKLASWNPLDDVRRPQYEEDDFSDSEYDNTLNFIDVFNRHFLRMKHLDPNSQEALKACRYLRRKESPYLGLSKENTKDSIRSRKSRMRVSRAEK